MKQIAIIDNLKYEKLWQDMISGEFIFEIAENAEFFADKTKFDAIIINADFAGNRISDIINQAKGIITLKNKPMAVMMNECNCEKQDYLCSCGVDDILMLPICARVLMNRINMLIAAFPEITRGRQTSLDIDELMCFVDNSRNSKGALCVPKNEFANVCNFVLRGLERSEKSAQVLLFTLMINMNDSESYDNGSVMKILSTAIQQCLRRGDMSSVYSDNQVLALLIGADDDGGHLVANRIVSNFYSECCDDAFELQYDIREIKVKK